MVPNCTPTTPSVNPTKKTKKIPFHGNEMASTEVIAVQLLSSTGSAWTTTTRGGEVTLNMEKLKNHWLLRFLRFSKRMVSTIAI
jgi:outer membrane protein assembly factor BamA